jgi:hypothetical protein
MKQRQSAQIDIALVKPPRLDQRALCRQHSRLRQQGAARTAANSGGVDDHETSVRIGAGRPMILIGGRQH